jgi:hypothetical protein
MFRHLLEHPDRYPDVRYPGLKQIRDELAGWDLACWCPVPDGYISPAAAATRLHLVLTAVMREQDERAANSSRCKVRQVTGGDRAGVLAGGRVAARNRDGS